MTFAKNGVHKGKKILNICGQIIHNICGQRGKRVKTSNIFVDVTYGRPLTNVGFGR